MTIFSSKMDFLSANSGFAVQNDRTYLPRIMRETCISQFKRSNSPFPIHSSQTLSITSTRTRRSSGIQSTLYLSSPQLIYFLSFFLTVKKLLQGGRNFEICKLSLSWPNCRLMSHIILMQKFTIVVVEQKKKFLTEPFSSHLQQSSDIQFHLHYKPKL